MNVGKLSSHLGLIDRLRIRERLLLRRSELDPDPDPDPDPLLSLLRFLSIDCWSQIAVHSQCDSQTSNFNT